MGVTPSQSPARVWRQLSLRSPPVRAGYGAFSKPERQPDLEEATSSRRNAPHLSRDGRVVARNKGVVNSRAVNFGAFSMSRGTLGWVAPGLPSFTWLEIDR